MTGSDDRAMGTRRTTHTGRVTAPFARVTERTRASTRRTVLAASVLAATTVLTVAVVRIALNAGVASSVVGPAYPLAETAALVCPAGAALCCGITAPIVGERVGLVSVGVFGLLAAVVPAAVVPAVGASVAGGGLALYGLFGRRHRTSPTVRATGTQRANRTIQANGWGRITVVVAALAAAAVVGGGVLTLAAGIGLLPASVRGPGSLLALCGLAATPALVHPSRRAWLVGALAGVGVLLAGAVAPFVFGAVTLVAWAAVDVSVVAIAAGVGGVVATVASGLGCRDVSTAIGGACLLGAGVPATVPRMLGVVLGLWLLAGGLARAPVNERPGANRRSRELTTAGNGGGEDG